MLKQFSYNTENVGRGCTAVGIIHILNGCCRNQAVLLVANKSDSWESGINYSCQCGCGGWCTNGHGNTWEAVKEYENMTTQILGKTKMKGVGS